MWKQLCYFLLALSFFTTGGMVFGDKGQMWPSPVSISEPGQKAIIFNNGKEETLILGTEIASGDQTSILEFIPFPSEPTVSLAAGDPFGKISRLIAQKGLRFMEESKGEGITSPVEVRFSGQIGLHDVTVVRIVDSTEFETWAKEFFRGKGIDVTNDLAAAYANAVDYMKRGFSYFVFDYVHLDATTQSIEPLVYKFASLMLYYPFKTSNIVGGEGGVDIILVLPGSIGLMEDRSDFNSIRRIFGNNGEWSLSSSSKVYPGELDGILPETDSVFPKGPVYIQALKFRGSYDFKDDLHLDISNIAPFAYKHESYNPDYSGKYTEGSYSIVEPYSGDELADVVAAYANGASRWYFDPLVLDLVKNSKDTGTEASSQAPRVSSNASSDIPLKTACLSATMRAIGMEIRMARIRLDAAKNGPGDSANIPVFEKQIADFGEELAHYAEMNPSKYSLPERKTVSFTVTGNYNFGSILELDDITRSGPFYHLAGIAGDDFSVLEKGHSYKLSIYLVYKRDYVLPTASVYYVYADKPNPTLSSGARESGEEILLGLDVKPNSFTITVGSNGCTSKNSFRITVRKKQGLSERVPHYVFTVNRIVPDECKMIVEEGTSLTYDLEKDFDIHGACTFSIANGFFSGQ
jgi:hypothetical protein